MRIKNTKWTLYNFLIHEHKSFEEYLSVMAEKGWQIVKLGKILVRFERCDIKKIEYAVDVIEFDNFYDGIDSHAAIKQREKYKEVGWNFVCEGYKVQVYFREGEVFTGKVEYNEENKFKLVSKISLKYILFNIIAAIVVLFSAGNIFWPTRFNMQFLANNMELSAILFSLAFFVYEIITAINFIIWKVKGISRLKRNESVEYKRSEYMKIKSFANALRVITFMLMVLSMVKLPSIMYKTYTMPLTLEDFTDNNINKYEPTIFRDNGVLASNICYGNTNDKISINYELFQSKYKWAINYTLEKRLEFEKSRREGYKKIETNLPEGISVYKGYDTYLIVSKNKIIEMDILSEEVNEDEILDIVYNKVFKE